MVLRRTGLRPLVVAGRLLAAVETDVGEAAHAEARIRLALYACGADGYAIAIGCDAGGQGKGGWHHAAVVGGLAAAAAGFETASPDFDGLLSAEDGADAGAIMIGAARRVCSAAALRHEFAHAVGMFLHRLSLEAARVSGG